MALDSFLVDASLPSLVVPDGDRFHDTCGFRTRQIDRQQAVLQVRSLHLNAVSQHKGPLELACRDAAVKVFPGFIFLLPATDHQLVLLSRHVELLARKAGNRQRDAQPLGILLVTRQPLDVVGWIAVGRFRHAVEDAFDLVKPEQERTGERRNSGHSFQSPPSSDFERPISAPLPARVGTVPHPVRHAQIWGCPVKRSRTRFSAGFQSVASRRRVPSALKTCSFARTAIATARLPGAGAWVPGSRTMMLSPRSSMPYTKLSGPTRSTALTVSGSVTPSTAGAPGAARARSSGRTPMMAPSDGIRPLPSSSAGSAPDIVSRFIAGAPMKVATNVVAGFSYTSSGAPICSTLPAFITTNMSASVIAS